MGKKKIRNLVIISTSIIIIDQIIKIIIGQLIKDSIKIIPRILEIEVIKNTGFAFGLNSGNIKNIMITIIVLILIINFIKNQFKLIDNKTMFSLSLMLGGGVSNLIDRFIRGGVFDFIKISTFPIFNLADITVVVGWILLVINIIKFSFYENKNKE